MDNIFLFYDEKKVELSLRIIFLLFVIKNIFFFFFFFFLFFF